MKSVFINRTRLFQFAGLLLLLCLIYACQNDFERDYSKLKSSKIEIPSDMSMTYEGKDTVINDIWTSDLKLIVYKDSTSCTSCFIETLPRWNDIILKYRGRLSVIFILSPENGIENDIRLLLQVSDFKYPVILDTNKSFCRTNPQISANRLLHVFLIDKSNRVVFIGNPLSDKEINSVFEKRLREY